jgi:hypothetical protein
MGGHGVVCYGASVLYGYGKGLGREWSLCNGNLGVLDCNEKVLYSTVQT